MPITSLKLSEELRRRIRTIAAGSDRTAHAFMVDAIERAARAEELRRRFGEEAQAAEEETLRSGKAYDASEVFGYLETRARGRKPKRPRLKSWRRSG